MRLSVTQCEPLRSESSPQKRSGTGRVLKGSHSFTCTLARSIRNRNEPYLPNLPSQLQLVLIYRPRRDGRLNWPDTRNKLFVPFSVEQLVIPNLVKRVFVRFRFRLFETVDVCKVLDVINQKPTFISCDYSLVLVGFFYLIIIYVNRRSSATLYSQNIDRKWH